MPPRSKSRPGKSDSASTPLSTNAAPVSSINWPPLSPLPSPYDLSLEPLIPSQIVTISRLFTTALCNKYISFLRTLPLTTTPGKPKRGDAVRVNDRYQIDDPAFSRRLWEESGLMELVLGGDLSGLTDGDADDDVADEEKRKRLWGGKVLGLNPNIRVYRYTEGQFFDKHYDDSNLLLFPTASGTTIPARTTWTLLLYLSTCDGGETVFYPEPPPNKSRKSKLPAPEPVAAAPGVGMALLHRHGKDCMLHEGREVTAGEKWVLRSDLCVRR